MLCPRCKEILRKSGKAKIRAQNACFRISSCESVFASTDHLDSLVDCELCLIFKSTVSEGAMELAMRNKSDTMYQTAIVDDGRTSIRVNYRMSFHEFDGKVSHALEFQYYIYEDRVNPRIQQTLYLTDSRGIPTISYAVGVLHVNDRDRTVLPRSADKGAASGGVHKLKIDACPC